jgi:RNA polymerase sigma-70 factor, ECF subfamily
MRGAVPVEVEREMASDLSFETFFSRNRDRLFRALWLVTRDRHEAEEVSQDAFLKVWEGWDRIAALEDPEGYLFRTAMNLCRNRVRRSLLALRRTIRTAPRADELRAIEDRDQVVRALRELTRSERGAVVLVDLLGMTSEEAGRTIGIRPSTVRVLVARARTKLREQMGGDDA